MEDGAEIRSLHHGEGLPIKVIPRLLSVSRKPVALGDRGDGPPR
jgi:hypothetical protein